MKAVVLAGGKGTRLSPDTKILPRPLMPIGDLPILEVILRQMKGAGISKVILTVGHLSEILKAFFQDGHHLIDFHREQYATATIAVHRRKVKVDLGVVQSDESSRINGYIEKTTYDYSVSMGLNVIEPRVISDIPRGEYLDFPDLVKKRFEAGEKVVGYNFDGYGQDLGRPDDYEIAAQDFEKTAVQVSSSGACT